MAIEKLNDIYWTECVCFPRSGNHALAAFLTSYFGPAFRPCETETFRGLPLWNPDFNWVKNHDEGLLTTVHLDRKYMVQIRDPFDTLQSWYLMNRDAVYDKDIRYLFDGSNSEIYDFLREKLPFWHSWVQKWVLQRVPNRLIIQYEMMAREPERVMSRVIEFMTGRPPYTEPFKATLAQNQIWPGANHHKFFLEEVESC